MIFLVNRLLDDVIAATETTIIVSTPACKVDLEISLAICSYYRNLIELLSGEEKDDVKTVLGNNCTSPHWNKTRTDSIRYNIMRLPTAHLIAALKLKKTH